ncbi:MAG: hypothetical protein EAZ08_10350 [Cytophagales bacterium]|nr:MAG: hypothetical protein EAZ08_10350 [Cytophagales bacterium]
MCCFLSIGKTFSQPKGSLAPKERDIEDAPEDSIATPVYYGMSYEALLANFGSLKSYVATFGDLKKEELEKYVSSDPMESLQEKEKKLRSLLDTIARLIIFMEAPIKKREAESAAKEVQYTKLRKEVENRKEEYNTFVADRDSRLKLLDSLSKPVEEDTVVVQESNNEEEDWGYNLSDDTQETKPTTAPSEEKTDKKEGKKKNTGKEKKEDKKNESNKKADDKKKNGKDTGRKEKEVDKNSPEEKEKEAIRLRQLARKEADEKKVREAKQKAEQEAKAKQKAEQEAKAKQKQDEKLKAKNSKQQEKFIEKEAIALDKAYDDSVKMVETLQLLEDSLARSEEDQKAFEDSTELLRKNLQPVKELSAQMREAWAKLHYVTLNKTQEAGNDAEADFNAIIDDFHNTKIDAVLNELDNASFIERIKTLRDNIFLSKRIPNIDCGSGIGNFMKGSYLAKEEIEKVWEEIGKQVWGVSEKNKKKSREISAEEYRSIGRSAGCVGYVLGLGDDCNLVLLKLIDESKIAIVCKKNKEDDMSAIKLIK